MAAARILIVEDELIVAEDLRLRLLRLGYVVVDICDNGQSALETALVQKPDLILMDIQLPGDLDGVAVAERLRVSPSLAVPVVYLTAHADEATLRRARVTEPYGYILKPFEERELRVVIEMALYKSVAERRLRESETLFRTFMEHCPAVAFIKDEQGRYSYVNSRWLALFPGSVEWLGKRDQELLPAEFAQVSAETDRQVMETNSSVVIQDTSPPSDGKVRHWVTCKFPILNPGAASAIGGFSLEVTEQRRLEEQLRHVSKMEAFGQLAGGVAHDFNNLLTVINGNVGLILAGVGIDHPWHGFLADALRAGERAADLTKQLLSFARKKMVQPRVHDLNRVLVETARLLKPLLGEHIQIRTQLESLPMFVRADPGQLEQVLVNLAVNARDAMVGGGVLSFTTEKTTLDEESLCAHPNLAKAPGYVRLTVQDNGCGMDQATLARIFEPFFTTKEQSKGTGLGLAIVYGIIKQSDGSITATSESAQGTTFTILLPLIEERRESAQGVVTDLPRGEETILLVEDEERVRALVRQILQGCGYTILEASNGVEALELLARYSGPLDLLLSDVVMPWMDGFTLGQLVIARREGIRVLFMSGNPDAVRPQSCEEFLLLDKPFTPTQLAQCVRQVLDGN